MRNVCIERNKFFELFNDCGKPGHFKQSCPLLGSSNQDSKTLDRTEEKKLKANSEELQ